jgi:hypothetical protein
MITETRNCELAPCGVYCGACPSFGRTCSGCPSEDLDQKRTSKWSCKIRTCCYETKGHTYCIQCAEFPCKTISKKLLDSHPGEPRFSYRHEITDVFPKLLQLGEAKYHQFQRDRWICPECSGRVVFYHFRCRDCEKEDIVIA